LDRSNGVILSTCVAFDDEIVAAAGEVFRRWRDEVRRVGCGCEFEDVVSDCMSQYQVLELIAVE
jgi:hypothetical protein